MKYILILLTVIIIISCGEDAVTPPTMTTPQNCGKIPIGSKINEETGINDSLRIVALMPDPTGEDDYNEYFIIKNFSNKNVNLSEYVIYDDDDTIWNLPNITLSKCDSLKLVSDKTAQLLNSGDKVILYKYYNKTLLLEIQSLEYIDSDSGIEERYDK